jgi:hypothetical protein
VVDGRITKDRSERSDNDLTPPGKTDSRTDNESPKLIEMPRFNVGFGNRDLICLVCVPNRQDAYLFGHV